METFSIKTIGRIHSPHKKANETPIQPVFAKGVAGTVVVEDEYAEGLQGLEGFSYIYLLYYFDKAQEVKLRVRPFLQDSVQGVFATRAPCRPNGIGFSLVRLQSIQGTTLYIEDVDVLDNTPLLDIKPFVARFDVRQNVRSGWQDEVDDELAQKRGVRDYPSAEKQKP